MGLSISVTITTTDGEKPTFNVNADWSSHLADFNLTVQAADGTTTIVPSVNFLKVQGSGSMGSPPPAHIVGPLGCECGLCLGGNR